MTGILRMVALQPFLPQIANDLDVTVPLVGQAATMSMITAAFLSLITGPLADLFGRRRMILTGQALLVMSTVLVALTPSYTLLLLAGFISGVGSAANQGVAFGFIVSRFSGTALRKAISYAQSSGSTIVVIGPPVSTLIGVIVNWRVAILVLAGVMIVGLAFAAYGLPADAKPSGERPSRKAMTNVYAEVLRNRIMLVLYAGNAIRSMSFIGLVVYFAAYLQVEYDLSIQYVGVVLALSGVGMFFGNFAVGNVLREFDSQRLYASSTVLMSVSGVLIYVIISNVFVSIGMMTFLYFVEGVGFTCGQILIANASTTSHATVMSLS